MHDAVGKSPKKVYRYKIFKNRDIPPFTKTPPWMDLYKNGHSESSPGRNRLCQYFCNRL